MSNQNCSPNGRRLLLWLSSLSAAVLLIVLQAASVHAEDDLGAQLQRATAYHDKADYAHSVPILRHLVQQSPRSYSANLLLGEDLFHSGAIEDAIAPLERACRLQPRDAVAEAFLADAAASLGDYPMAAEALQAGIARSKGSGQFLEAWAAYCLERYRLLGLSLRSTKRGEAVMLRVEAASRPEGTTDREALLQQSVRANPEQPGIWGELGIAQLELHKRADALESLKAARSHEPEDAQTVDLAALLAIVDRNWTEAERQLQLLAARSPVEYRNALLLCRHMLPATRASAMIAGCLHAQASCPITVSQAPAATTRSAQRLFAEGRWEQLIAQPRPRPEDGVGWLWQGVALAKTGDCAHAISSLERGLKADEYAAGFWLEVCYSDEAEKAASRLKAEKDERALHQLRGDVLLRLQGNATAALKEYEEALKLRPDEPALLERLAETYMRLGDTARAQSAARKALAINPHEAEALRALALLAASDRDYDQALRWLRKLIVEAPADMEVRVQLGNALAHTGNAAEAVEYLAPALEAGYPDERGALHATEARALRALGRDAEAEKAATQARALSDAFQSRSQTSAKDGKTNVD